MKVRIGTGLSTHPDPRVGAIEAAAAARDGLDGARTSLAVVFACGNHLAAPEATLEGVHEALLPAALIGCGAGGVIGGGREVEAGTAVTVWAAAADGGLDTFHADAPGIGEERDDLSIDGIPDLASATGVVLLTDPGSFPTDRLLRDLGHACPGLPVLGGIASASTDEGTAALFFGDRVVDRGAVGLRLEGVDMLPCVSQGAAPVGPELIVTAADGHVIRELAGVPALEHLREVIGALDDDERAMTGNGLLMGIAVGGGRPDDGPAAYGPGDFLVGGLLGADPDAGTIAVGARVRPGQVIRLHARDAASARRDLDAALALRMEALGDRAPAGALLFSCNGRGSGMFGAPDHDAGALARGLAGAPVAGFFAAGEIGPVGVESFLHGFTATVAIFPG